MGTTEVEKVLIPSARRIQNSGTPAHLAGGKWHSHPGHILRVSNDIKSTLRPSNPPSWHLPQREPQKASTRMHSSLFIVPPSWRQGQHSAEGTGMKLMVCPQAG